MKSLLEAVAIIMLFFLTPMIAVSVLISLARVVENIGDLPIDEKEALAVRHWAGASSLEFLCQADDELCLFTRSHLK
jgi:hypothetical protein